jgi:hypothetical protein
MMVAAHNYDLRAARSHGMRTAVWRQLFFSSTTIKTFVRSSLVIETSSYWEGCDFFDPLSLHLLGYDNVEV